MGETEEEKTARIEREKAEVAEAREKVKAAEQRKADAQAKIARQRAEYEKLQAKFTTKDDPYKIANFDTAGDGPDNRADDWKPDLSNIFARPSDRDLDEWGVAPESNVVATSAALLEIASEFGKMGVPAGTIAPTCWALSRYGASVGASDKLDADGNAEASGNLARDTLIGVIRKHTTFRKFCRSYAPITWNIMLKSGIAPEKWASTGIPYDLRFCAFDAFEAVENSSAVQPADGLKRRPTDAEYKAYFAWKAIKLHDAQKDTVVSHLPEVTGAKDGCKPKLNIRSLNC
ncbi:coat protein [Rose virus C]|nr:coat protein [Rose virus C]